jgi:hypothetical protein
VARVVEWLRRKQQKVALLTNGHQWRLIHAGADYDAWCEWDTDAWFLAGAPGPQIEALRLLLGREALTAPAPSGTPPLLAAIQATRRGQAELSSALGERVRLAVEILLRESREAIDAARADKDHPVTNRDVYIAAARIVMRLVVILFAESRNLLPRDNTIYWNSYSLDFLRDTLPVDKDGRPFNHLFHQYSAWPRLLALGRLLYHGLCQPGRFAFGSQALVSCPSARLFHIHFPALSRLHGGELMAVARPRSGEVEPQSLYPARDVLPKSALLDVEQW